MAKFVRAITSASRQKVIEKQARVVRSQLEKTLVPDVRDKVIGHYKHAVADWKEKPKFRGTISVKPDSITLNVAPVIGKSTKKNPSIGQIFQWVDKGTKPYVIRPRKKPALAFRANYRPRTKYRAKSQQGPGTANGPWQHAQKVNHPGIEARDFSGQIADDYKVEFKRTVEVDLRRAIRRERRR